ncbi:MAG: hypothetical protein M3Z33_12895 [Actinomycetota bacterium]|nr:hypothetical protein [Actinomycetota bacterium]
MQRKHLIVGGVVFALAAGGAGAASAIGSDHDRAVAGTSSDQARSAALRYTGGGRAGIVEADTEHGATWGVEVTKPDGSPVDVRLDARYKLIEITGNADG